MVMLNRRQRLELIFERDGDTCVWCGRVVGEGLVEATTEHIIPKVKGGPSWIENEVAACKRCNGRRGHRTLADWTRECEGNGWEPDTGRIVRVLTALDERIGIEGGQRRARKRVSSELRRFQSKNF